MAPDKKDVLQLVIHKDNFTPIQKIDKSFSYKWLYKLDQEGDLTQILDSINLMLKDWKEAPTFDDIISRFDAGSFVMLQYYKNEPIGWFWGNTRLTYNWIDIIKDLPSANSMYGGGSYITKNKNIPKNTGIQLYTKFFHDIFDFYKSAYGYVDSWNKAPIRLNKRSGAIEINNLL
tara:strand:- start:1124 stop:1648 length:525 start_codon:yes stop_codon:yes gene_type:complete